jgi:NAD(P)H-hydrate epimerase
LKTLLAGRKVVLTPHLGEFRALFPALASMAEQDPWGAAMAAAKESGATVLLKGVPTVVATPDGAAPLTIASGNPGLATGGSGDVLSGLIGAALAAGLDPFHAAALGAQALGRAGDLAARRTSARSMRPMDVVNAFPDLWRAWDLRGAARPAPRAPVLVELERPKTS